MKPAHLPYLDGLRGCAILLVLWVHFPFANDLPGAHAFWEVGQAIRGGYIGVDLFFVLSGFLITRLLIAERIEAGRISLRLFYARRTLRIFPIYYLAILVCSVAFHFSSGEIWSLSTYTFDIWHSFHPQPVALEQTWSLCVEEQFYLLWPFLIARIDLRHGRIITGLVLPAIAMGVALIFATHFHPTLAADLIYKSGATRMLSLSLGGYLAFREWERRPSATWRWVALGAVGMALLAADAIGRARGEIHAGGFYWMVALPGYGFVGLATVGLLTSSTIRPVALARHVLSWRRLRGIGRISYGVYLYHVPVLYALHIEQSRVGLVGAPAWRVVLALVLSFAVAMLSWHLVEMPLLRLKARLPRHEPGRGLAAPSSPIEVARS